MVLADTSSKKWEGPEPPGIIHDEAGGSTADPSTPPHQREWPGQARPSRITGSARPEGPGMTPPPTEAFTVEINRPRTLGDRPHGYNKEKARVHRPRPAGDDTKPRQPDSSAGQFSRTVQIEDPRANRDNPLRRVRENAHNQHTPNGAGISLKAAPADRPRPSPPRDNGDGPTMRHSVTLNPGRVPQAREPLGRTTRDIHHHDRRVSPAGAGMVPLLTSPTLLRACKPRRRGDGPRGSSCSIAWKM